MPHLCCRLSLGYHMLLLGVNLALLDGRDVGVYSDIPIESHGKILKTKYYKSQEPTSGTVGRAGRRHSDSTAGGQYILVLLSMDMIILKIWNTVPLVC